jgi:hypothetical protein
MRRILLASLILCTLYAHPTSAAGEPPTLSSLKPTLPKPPTGNPLLDITIGVVGNYVYDLLKAQVNRLFPNIGENEAIDGALMVASNFKTAVISIAASGYVSPNGALNIIQSDGCARGNSDRVTLDTCKDINASDKGNTILGAPYDIVAPAESRTVAGWVWDDAIANPPHPTIITGKGELTGEYLFSAVSALAFIGDWWQGPGEFEFAPLDVTLRPAKLAKPLDPKFKLVPNTTNIDSDAIDDIVVSPGDSISLSLLLDRSHEEQDFNAINSVSFGLNYDPTEIAFSNHCALSPCTIQLPNPIYAGMSPVVIQSFDLGVLMPADDGLLDFGILFLTYEDEQLQTNSYSLQPLETQFEVQPVPAPLPLLGVGGIFGYTRKLRILAKRLRIEKASLKSNLGR